MVDKSIARHTPSLEFDNINMSLSLCCNLTGSILGMDIVDLPTHVCHDKGGLLHVAIKWTSNFKAS